MENKKELKTKLIVRVFEEDGSIFAMVNGKQVLLACDKDIEVKTEIALDNIISELECDLENFIDRENMKCLITGEFEDDENIKRGRL